MKPDFWTRMKIYFHAGRKQHQIIQGFQNSQPIIYCECGYYKPRVRPRGKEEPVPETKFLTNTEVEKLIRPS